jgi:D-inositol-3-phosphate glycosyltransferase
VTSNRMKIAMLSVHSCPVGTLGTKDTGGMSVYIVELARELGRKGHLVDIYTRVHDPRDRQTENLADNVRLIHLKAGEDQPMHKLAIYPHLPDFSCALEAFRKQDGAVYDLVFSHYWLSGWVGQYLKLWWQVPNIVMFHTLGAAKNAIGIGESSPDLRIETERDLAINCRYIIAPTEREKEAVAFYYGANPDKIGVVPCGVNLELFRPVSRAEARRELGFGSEKVVLYVGRLDPLKGPEQLIKAMSLLENGGDSRLVIVGGDENNLYKEELLELAGGLGIADSISFTGPVRQDRLPGFYSAADVCVVPSYYESFGLVALEALACGSPVVSTDVGAAASIIRQGEAGYLAEDNEPHHLAEKIDLVLSRPPRDEATALSIRRSVTGYNWQSVADGIEAEMRRVLERRCMYVI